jgi:hypothetical protein
LASLAITRDGQRDDHLRLVVAAFLAMAAPAQRGIQFTAPQLTMLVRFVDLEVGGVDAGQNP